MMRLLVTGSRDWDHLDSINAVLAHYARQADWHGGRLVVVHGDAARGADALAAAWIAKRAREGWPVSQESHPADWRGPCRLDLDCKPGHRKTQPSGGDYCPRAGHHRNQAMVDAGAAVCVGFWRNGSSGTRDCLGRAEKAGIPLLRVTWGERELVAPGWLAQNAPELVA